MSEDDPGAQTTGNGFDPGAGPAFRLIRFRDIVLDRQSPCIIGGLVPRDGIVVVYGPPKCGKSFLIFDLAMYVAMGWDWRGQHVEPGIVVYVACEGGRGLAARVAAFRKEKLQQYVDQEPDPDFYLITTRLNLPAQCGQLAGDIYRQLTATGGEPKCQVIVLDTLNRSIGGSESDDRDMAAYIVAADSLREMFGCTVIIIHHCGIETKRPRGHTSLAGAADAQIAVTRDSAKHIVAKVEFLKDGVEGAEFVSSLKQVDLGNDENGNPITSCVVEPVDEPAAQPNGKTKLSAAETRGLELLVEAINTAGEVPPACNHIPTATRCATENLWRGYCYAGSVAGSDKPDAKQKAFKRAADGLITAKRIKKWEQWVWILPNGSI